MTHDQTPPALAEAFDLDAISARADAATPGPWAITDRNGDHVRRKLRGADDRMVLGIASLLWPDPEDEAFITRARDDVPALVAEVLGLRARIEGALSAMDAGTYGDPEVPFRMRLRLDPERVHGAFDVSGSISCGTCPSSRSSC